MSQTHTFNAPGAAIVYDVHGPLPPVDGRPPLLLIAQPMDASGFAALVELLRDRTLITYDPRGLGRSVRTDGRSDNTPDQQAEDLHGIIAELDAGPVELFASSGGAITALALVTAHPEDVSTLVAHEPPLFAVLPDADRAFAAERAMQDAYRAGGSGPGMAAFIALSSWQGELTDEFAAQPLPDPATFGLSADDDGSRDDPLLSDVSNAVTAYRPEFDTLRAAPTRIVVAAGIESKDMLTWRASEALAAELGTELAVFPSHHGGFMGGEFGYAGEPEAFAARLREVLESA
jgi:pimeloyl-ACP methyl ester carboxylesterase